MTGMNNAHKNAHRLIRTTTPSPPTQYTIQPKSAERYASNTHMPRGKYSVHKKKHVHAARSPSQYPSAPRMKSLLSRFTDIPHETKHVLPVVVGFGAYTHKDNR